MQTADIETIRTVRHELNRHQIDISLVSVNAHSGVVHLTGTVRPMRGHEGSFDHEIHALQKCLRYRPGVRDVVFEWEYPAGMEHIGKRADS